MIPLTHAASAMAWKADVTGVKASPLGNDVFWVVKPGRPCPDRLRAERRDIGPVLRRRERRRLAAQLRADLRPALHVQDRRHGRHPELSPRAATRTPPAPSWTCTPARRRDLPGRRGLDANDVVASLAAPVGPNNPAPRGQRRARSITDRSCLGWIPQPKRLLPIARTSSEGAASRGAPSLRSRRSRMGFWYIVRRLLVTIPVLFGILDPRVRHGPVLPGSRVRRARASGRPPACAAYDHAHGLRPPDPCPIRRLPRQPRAWRPGIVDQDRYPSRTCSVQRLPPHRASLFALLFVLASGSCSGSSRPQRQLGGRRPHDGRGEPRRVDPDLSSSACCSRSSSRSC